MKIMLAIGLGLLLGRILWPLAAAAVFAAICPLATILCECRDAAVDWYRDFKWIAKAPS